MGSGYLDLYVVGMLARAESLIPNLPPAPSTSAAYARISEDREREERGVSRQIEDARKLAASDGVTIPDELVFSDSGISASTLSRKPRPAFERMVAYVLAGQVTRIYAYSNSRLTRRPMELEVLMQLSRRHGLVIRTVVSGDDDLSTADGRMTAGIKAAVDAAEAERTGERVKRQKRQRLESGLPPGGRYRTFGYTRDWQLIPEESEIVREVFERCAGGESVNSIWRSLVERGVKTISDKPMSYAATARMLDSPIYAGLLSYKGTVTGSASDAVPRIVSEAMLDAAGQRDKRPAWNTRKHLLSGIAVCGSCHTAMNHTAKGYQCARLIGGCGGVKIKTEWLDDAVGHAVRFLSMWSREQDKPPADVPPEDDSEKLLGEIDRQIEATREANIAGLLPLSDMLPILNGLRERREGILRAQSQQVEDASVWQAMDDYDNADVSQRRTIIRRHVTAVIVEPSKHRGRNTYDPSRFKVVTVYRDDHGRERVLSGEACDTLGALWGARSFAQESPDHPALRETFTEDVIEAVWSLVDR